MKRHRVFVSAILGIMMVSCASSPLPPALPENQSARLKELPLHYTVGVARFEAPAYSDSLTTALASSGIFRQVAPLDHFRSRPDLIATIEERIHGTAVIPAVTFVTLGLIPTIVEERHGFRFALAPSKNPERKTIVDASYSGHTTLGWAALGINASSNYSADNPEDTERFRKMLAHRTLSALRP